MSRISRISLMAGTGALPGLRALASRRARLAAGGTACLAVAAGLLVSGMHDAYPTTRVPQESGLAWVTSDQIGALTLLDGVAGQPAVNVPVAHVAGDPLLAAQDGTAGYALDETTGQLSRVDGSSYTPLTARQPPAGAGPALQLLAGRRTVYTVNGGQGSVGVYDAATLRQEAGPVPFAPGSSSYTAVVDAADQLWILDSGSGRLTWFSGTASHRGATTFTPGGATLVLADGEPVVVDRGTRRAYLIGPDGSPTADLDLSVLGPDAGSGLGFSGAAAQQALLVTDSIQGTYRTCTFALGGCSEPLRAGFGGDTLGRAVTAAGRVFVPDYTTGTVWVLDPSGAAQPVHTGTLTSAGPFDLFDRNGLIFYNDPHTSQAGTIAPDGVPVPIAKYSSATPPSPSPSAIVTPRPPSATATPTSSRSAVTGPTATSPTTSATAPGPEPSRSPSGTATHPGPGGKPTPTPHPTQSGTATVSCGQTVTKSIILTANLSCSGNGLTIGAANVTIDLAGHTLSGDGTGTGITFAAASGTLEKPVLENGTVSGFGTGLAVGPNGEAGAVISTLHFRNDSGNGATLDIGLATADGMQVDETTFSQDSGLAIRSDGVLEHAFQVSGSTFTGGGISVKEAPLITPAITVTDSQFSGGSVYLQDVGNSTFEDNTFDNTSVTDMCHDDGGDMFTGNTFDGPVLALNISSMADETIADNRFNGNRVGVELSIGNNDVGDSIDDNTFTDEGDVGVLVDDTASSATPVAVTIDANTASGNGGNPDGITDAGGTQAIGGIHIYAPAGQITVSDNHTGPDQGYGIWSLTGTAQGTGNISSHDTKNCVPVTLCTYS